MCSQYNQTAPRDSGFIDISGDGEYLISEVLKRFKRICDFKENRPEVICFITATDNIVVPTSVAVQYYKLCHATTEPMQNMAVILDALYAGIQPEQILKFFEGLWPLSESQAASAGSVEDAFRTLALDVMSIDFAKTAELLSVSSQKLAGKMRELSACMSVDPFETPEDKIKHIDKVRRHRARKGRKR